MKQFRRTSRKRVLPFSHFKAVAIAVGHYALSLGVGFMVFATAWGLGLSDVYHDDAPLKLWTCLLMVLQAPTVLIVGIGASAGVVSTTTSALCLALLAIPSSLLYGYAIVLFFRKKRLSHQSAGETVLR